ncbi:hypothetical protein [Saccharothrix sp. Mg75]|uniref:hypothetical protein n=1 Tax=Saccharothrix sp. Mg75 TaxID=3445357 RepID=UPI003EEB5FEB
MSIRDYRLHRERPAEGLGTDPGADAEALFTAVSGRSGARIASWAAVRPGPPDRRPVARPSRVDERRLRAPAGTSTADVEPLPDDRHDAHLLGQGEARRQAERARDRAGSRGVAESVSRIARTISVIYPPRRTPGSNRQFTGAPKALPDDPRSLPEEGCDGPLAACTLQRTVRVFA